MSTTPTACWAPMDVNCNRCGTTYEFEEGLISSTGTTVKCTECGHLFKVHRDAPRELDPATSAALGLEEGGWQLRKPDGSQRTLPSLSALTDLLRSGAAGEDDMLSRTGRAWRRLGDIRELRGLLDVTPAFVPEVPPPRRQRRTTEPPPVPRAATEAGRSVPPDAPARRFESMGEQVALEVEVAVAGSPPPQPAKPDTTPSPPPSSPTGQPSTAPAAPPPAAPAPAPAQTPGHAQATYPVTEPPAPARTGIRWLVWLTLSAGLLTAAGVAGSLLRREPPAVEEAQHPALHFLERADAALASHRATRFDEAVTEYTKALAFHEDDAHILSSISRVYAVWAQLLRDRNEDEPPTDEAEASAVKREQQRLAAQARAYGERAAQRNPGNTEAEIALSDALRLNGNLVAARAELDRARAIESVPSAETLRVAALLAIDEAGGDRQAGLKSAELAVAQDPEMIRTRLLLIRSLLAAGDEEGARMHLRAVDRLDPDHPGIANMGKALRMPKTVAVVAPPSRRQHKPHADATAAETPPGVEQDVDPMSLVRRGEVALEKGAVKQAQDLFEQALHLRPGIPRAKTGLGYVALENGQPRFAIRHFRPAADKGNPEAFIGLGDAYRRLGRMEDALAAYQTYLRRFPNGKRNSIARRQIDLLREQLGTRPPDNPFREGAESPETEDTQ